MKFANYQTVYISTIFFLIKFEFQKLNMAQTCKYSSIYSIYFIYCILFSHITACFLWSKPPVCTRILKWSCENRTRVFVLFPTTAALLPTSHPEREVKQLKTERHFLQSYLAVTCSYQCHFYSHCRYMGNSWDITGKIQGMFCFLYFNNQIYWISFCLPMLVKRTNTLSMFFLKSNQVSGFLIFFCEMDFSQTWREVFFFLHLWCMFSDLIRELNFAAVEFFCTMNAAISFFL